MTPQGTLLRAGWLAALEALRWELSHKNEHEGALATVHRMDGHSVGDAELGALWRYSCGCRGEVFAMDGSGGVALHLVEECGTETSGRELCDSLGLRDGPGVTDAVRLHMVAKREEPS